MFCENAVARFEQRFDAGIVFSVETPVRMLDEFLVPFVGSVGGIEKRFRVGGVNEDGDAEPSAFFPDRIEPRIVDSNKLAGFIADTEPEVLEEF